MFRTISKLQDPPVGDDAGDYIVPFKTNYKTPSMPSVLFADNDTDYRETYRWLLSSYGFQVRTAATGLECLKKLNRVVPDVMVLDLDLPWGGGDGVLQALRKEPWLLPTRIVLTLDRGARRRHVRQGWPSWVKSLFKPFSLLQLMEQASIDELIVQEPTAGG